MSDILQMFSGNPLTTFIGRKIEAATRAELENDDWALNLEICDIINENDDDAKDAVRAIRKRLQQIEQDRNFSITNRTLTVLETCVSNCSRRFHVFVMTKDFIQDLVKLIGPKNNPPIELQERVLRLIQRWAEAFRSQPDLNGVVTVYNDLKAKGVTFPAPDPTSNVPIQTPQATVPPQTQQRPPARPVSSTDQRQLGSQAMASGGSGGPVVLDGEGYNKISQDLGLVQSTVDMFNELMRNLETKNEDSDWELAADLSNSSKLMKDRIVELIERVANEDLTIELLRLNDDLNNIFVKYDRLIKNRTKSTPTMAKPATTRTSESTAGDSLQQTSASGIGGVSSQTANDLSLIDFNLGQSNANNVGPVDNKQKATDSPLDPFDTSRILSKMGQKPLDPGTTSTTTLAKDLGGLSLESDNKETTTPKPSDSKKTASGLPEEISSVREQDFAEIENWLSTDSGRDLTSIAADMPSMEPISIPNSEFEDFIANRALVASQKPKAADPKPSV